MSTVCPGCKQPMDGTACRVQFIRFATDDRDYRRLENATERVCHDCNAPVGGLHHDHCDMEKCPKCFMQLLGCPC